jgi:hypothetical protein
MKKTIFLLSAFALINASAFAQNKKSDSKKATKSAENVQKKGSTPAKAAPIAQAAPLQTTTPNQNADLSMKFNTEEHVFGTIPEGPAVTYDFEFKNIGKEPIILSGVQASCGCTTPTWTKEPIAPGKSGKVSATYNTQGRPGSFVKTITVNSNVGSKIIKISGNVEKAPESSVPANNNSMMKH